MIENKMHPIAPGRNLAGSFLLPLGRSPNALSLALQVPATRLHAIVNGRRAVTPDTALWLARYFGGDGFLA